MSRLLRITEFTKIMVERFKNLDGIAVDMTLGNGNDSEILAKYFKKIYAFDIQEIAIKNAKEKLKHYSNIVYYKDNHVNIDKYLDKPIDLFIYNLGYLPQHNKDITTQVKSTINSLVKALALIKKRGIIIISVYPGHEEGAKEAIALDDFIKELNDDYQMSYYKLSNNLAPYVICIYKIK